MTKVKLVGGPMNGRIVELKDPDDERFHVGRFWTYEWTNTKEDGVQLFALASRSRPVRRAVKWFIEKFGQHPAIRAQKVPHRRQKP
jgi:hypothetical protein